MYKITRYTKKQAKKYNVTVALSMKKGKKIDVFFNNNKIASIGAIGYSDYPHYIESHGIKYAKTRRKLYKKRHTKDRSITNSNGYWADKLLW